jgi:hypothetical protein
MTAGRALFSAAEGYEVWIHPRELGGQLCYKMASVQLAGRKTAAAAGRA